MEGSLSPMRASSATPTVRAVEASGYTHAGRVRPDNEDALGVYLDARLFVVADGMGGRSAGDVAARLAIDSVAEFFRAQRADPQAPWPFPVDKRVSLGANLLRVGMKLANRRLREAAAADASLARMGATIAALAIGETQLVAAHVGDARVYRLRRGHLARLTRDHSLLEEVRAAQPDLPRERLEAMAPGNVITRALGTRDEVEPTVYVNACAPGDLYLLCSDGLWGVLDDARLGELLGAAGDLDAACHGLIQAADAAGAPDNVTALLVRVR